MNSFLSSDVLADRGFIYIIFDGSSNRVLSVECDLVDACNAFDFYSGELSVPVKVIRCSDFYFVNLE